MIPDQLDVDILEEPPPGEHFLAGYATVRVQDVPTHHFIGSFLARRMAAETPDLVVFGHDLLNAYRQWPVREPAQCGTFLGTRHGVTFWYHLAMNFGATASVWNFNRGADALQQILRGLLLLTTGTTSTASTTPPRGLGHALLPGPLRGARLPDQAVQGAAPGEGARGPGSELQHFHRRGHTEPDGRQEGENPGAYARAADTAAWSADSLSDGLAAALRSLDRIIPAIKPRFIPFDAKDIEVAVLYADAFFSAGEVRHKAGHVPDGVSPTQRQKAANGWGYVLRIGDQVFYDHGVAPTWFVKIFAMRKAYIYMLEILAQLVAFVTFGAKLPTAIIAFIDNTAGQAALTKGYGKDGAVNGMIAAFWSSLAAHQGWLVEFERVPSKANVADAVSGTMVAQP